MPVLHFPYRSTRLFAPVVPDHVERDPFLRDFTGTPAEREALFEARSSRILDPALRTVLVDAIREGYAGMSAPTAVQANINLLLRAGTTTVTTGHQLCLFTGPLYVPLKILNVVRLARELSTTDRPVVPIFWMATEDHDLPEVDHVVINGHRVHWASANAGGAVGRLLLEGIGPVVEEAIRLMGPGPFASETADALRQAYRPGFTLAQATRRFVTHLFGRFGVVCVDGDHPGLKQAFVPVMHEELLNSITERAVGYANEKLAGRYSIQAHAREINLFHLRPGHRSRIERTEQGFKVLDGGPEFRVDDMLDAVSTRPQDFSPNVLLRPLFQESVLPNIAYVGGGGEVAYWLQLRWLFQAARIPMPAVVLRTSALWLDAKQSDHWKGLGLAMEDLFAAIEALRERVATERTGWSTSLADEQAASERSFDALTERLKKADPTLEGAALAAKTRALKGLAVLEHKLLRAAKRQQSDALARLNGVYEALIGRGLEERRENVLPRYAVEGPALLDGWLEALDPLAGVFTVFEGTG